MSLSSLWFKICHPRNLWHHAEYLPDLQLVRRHNDGSIEFCHRQRILKTRSLSELSDLFEGKEVFLVGSGPSVGEQDLEPLCNRPTLFLNGAIHLIESHKIRPQACMVVDGGFFRDRPDFLQLIPEQTPCVFSIGVIREVLRIHPDFFDAHPLYYVEKIDKPIGQQARELASFDSSVVVQKLTAACSLDISCGFVEAGTVMFAACQLMLFLAAREIILVGFDLGNADRPRFYENNSDRLRSGLIKAMHCRIIPHFELFARLCSERQFKIFNASHLTSVPYEVIPFTDRLMPQPNNNDALIEVADL